MKPTTVFDNYEVEVAFSRRRVLLTLWDTASADEYSRLRPLSYPHSSVFVIGLSTVSRRSYTQACTKVAVALT